MKSSLPDRPLPPHPPQSLSRGKWAVHALALFAAAFTWPLLISGGQVTTYQVGMAVPDWPTTFGENMFLYDFWNTSMGVFIEHRHRLFGSALGITAIALAAGLFWLDDRRWMKWLGVGALLAVIVQGLIGGSRVLLNSTTWAAVHGVSGQLVFALLTALAVFTGRDWLLGPPPIADDGRLRRRCLTLLAMVGIQIALGAWVRHFPSPWAAGIHAFVAAAVLGQGAGLFWRVRRGSAGRDDQPLRRPALAMAIILGIQVVLGLAALVILWPFDGIARSFSTPQAMIRTGHQANGALLLASVVVLSLRILRHRYRLPVSEAGAVVSPVVASGTSEILA